MTEKRKSITTEPLPASTAGSRNGSLEPDYKPLDLDDVLVNELGQFGRFQFYNILLVAIPMIMSAFITEYVFSAATIPHRCQIPECGENSKDVELRPEWILNAVPETGGGLASCERYAPLPHNGSMASCPALLFDHATTVQCEAFVYARNNSVVYDFDLGCQEWLRALAGTLNSVGTLLVLPVTGYVSDRFGRRVALVVNVFNLGLVGFIRAFSVNYPMYLVLQLLQTTLGSGIVSCVYIFVAELVGPKYRVVTTATASSMFAVGQVIVGTVAWLTNSWRHMIMALHVPCFLVISYYWILSESVRWLLSKQKYDEVKQVLEKVARVNKKKISEKTLQALINPPPSLPMASDGIGLISTIFRSRVLLRRVCTTPVWWVTATFVYYGLSINSTGLSDQMYLNYIMTCAIEIPGFYTAVLFLDRIGRKATLSCGYFLCAACNLAFAFLPNKLSTLRLIIYLLGKMSISTVFSSLYLFTSELYPTEYRHSLLGFSSMVGRVGSILAPLTPPLMEYWAGIPSTLFGVMGVVAGLLVLTQPETLGRRMPDTLAEAEALGSS